ncbi:MAG: glutaminyl-peptide cyclotransferase [Calditrichaeota bacterium]|nr:glutaminyl-peptide cyclotransferase [Calditrichota bacterium]
MILKLQQQGYVQFNVCLILFIIFSCQKSSDPVSASPEITYSYRIVNEFPHRQDAFTQGLVYEGGFLYESTGLYGQSTVRQLEIETGRILQIIEIPSQYFGEGITVFNKKLFQLTWRSETCFVYDLFDLSLIDQFMYPGEGWGLTHDGINLIMSNGSSTICFLDPLTFEQVRKIEVTENGMAIDRLNELEYIEGEIFANVWLTNRIARISPITGKILGWLDMNGIINSGDCPQSVDVLNGIAYDANTRKVFITGKWWCKMFQIELIPGKR